MTALLRVEGIVVGPVDAEGDGRVERTVKNIVFMVPLDGGETGWHLDGQFQYTTATFRFTAPNVGAMIEKARTEAREEVISEFRRLPLHEIVERLEARYEEPDDDDV